MNSQGMITGFSITLHVHAKFRVAGRADKCWQICSHISELCAKVPTSFPLGSAGVCLGRLAPPGSEAPCGQEQAS